MISAIAHRAGNIARAFQARAFIGLLMTIMGLGRLGFYSSRPIAEALPQSTYGVLLAGLGLALLISHPRRHDVLGRTVDALGAILLAGLAYDAWVVAGIGVTMLTELAAALSLSFSCLLNHEC